MKKIKEILLIVALLIVPTIAVATQDLATLVNPDTGDKKIVEVGCRGCFDGGWILYDGYDVGEQSFGAVTGDSDLPLVIADFETSLVSSITSTATSMTLANGTTDAGNTLSGWYGFTIDAGSSNQEYVIGNCTGASCTSMLRGVSTDDGQTEVTALKSTHRRGSSVQITDHPSLTIITQILNGNDGIPAKLYYDSQPTLTSDEDIATKKYIDDTAIAGGVDASVSLKGITRLSINPASSTIPIAVGDNDTRVPTQDENNALVGTYGTPSSSQKYVSNNLINSRTANTAGYLTGGTGAQSAFATWAAITDGSFRATVDGTAYNVDAVDFSGDGSMADVATTLQSALQTATSGSETVAWSTDHFVITSATLDEDSEISVLETSTGTVGTDISGAGASDWMDSDTGNGVATQGTSDHDSLVKLDTDGYLGNFAPTTPSDSNDVASKSYVDAQALVIAVGSTTYNLTTASGVQNIAHGLGVIPKFVRIDGQILAATANNSPIIICMTKYDGTTQTSLSTVKDGNPGFSSSDNFRAGHATGANTYQTGIVTFDATNIIITWTKTGSPSGTLNLSWEALS